MSHDRTRRISQLALWLGLAAVACTATYLLHIATRGGLLWDEAARVLAGQELAFQLQRGDAAGAWTWLNNQTFYPFLLPAFQGVLLASGVPPVAAAWMPSLLAYGVSGILAGLLVRALGGNGWGAAVGGVGVWSIPQLASFAGGAYTEPFGVVMYLCVLLTITRLLTNPTRVSVALVISAVVIAFWIKPDYGVFSLVAIALTGLLALPGDANPRRRQFMVALLGSVAAEVIGLSFNLFPKLSGLLVFFTQAANTSAAPHSPASRDPFFYFHSLMADPGLGTGLFVGAILLLCTAVAAVRVYKERLLIAPILLVVIPIAAYSASSIQFTRYLLPAIAMQFVFVGWLASKITTSGSNVLRPAVVLLALILLGSEIPRYVAGDPSTVSPPAAEQARADIVLALGVDNQRILFLRPLNEVSVPLLQLSLDRASGRLTLPIFAPAAWTSTQPGGLEQMLSQACPTEVVAIEVDPGSSFDTLDYRLAWGPSAGYLQQAFQLQAAGVLTLQQSLAVDGGRARVWVWSLPQTSSAGSSCQVASAKF